MAENQRTVTVTIIEKPTCKLNGRIPEGFELVDLPSQLYMWFNGAPYEDESMFGVAHEKLYRAIANYKPELYGFEYAIQRLSFIILHAVTGVRQMIPVRRLPGKKA